MNHQLTRAQKQKNDKEYYRDVIDRYAKGGAYALPAFSSHSLHSRLRLNYRLYNGKLDEDYFRRVTNPWGSELKDIKFDKIENHDIVSSKIKAIVNMASKRELPYRVAATNPEATTRRETAEFDMIRNFVISQIMTPVEQEIIMEMAQQGTVSPSDLQAQLEARTPEEITTYMRREHQDPAEVLASQLLNYLERAYDINGAFKKGMKHAALSAMELYWIGEVNKKPAYRVINSLDVKYYECRSEDLSDAEIIVCEHPMSPSEIINRWGDELDEDQIDRIYEAHLRGAENAAWEYFGDDLADRSVRVLHVTWKGLRKIGILTYEEDGAELERFVDESYKLNKKAGDVKINWRWVAQAEEGWVILNDIHVGLGPVPGQFLDPDKLFECKLPYVGALYDADNAHPTSPMDRVRSLQYFYNILMYRVAKFTATDKGKRAFVNIRAVPISSKISLPQFEHYLENNAYTYLNPYEEGGRMGDMGSLVKEIDLSHSSDISKYINLAQYIEQRVGEVLGVPPTLEGRIDARDAVQNVANAVNLSTNVLEDYFKIHDRVKLDFLRRLLDQAKITYATHQPTTLSYVLDDLSLQLLNITESSQELLMNSTLGIFVVPSMSASDNKEVVSELAKAALNSQVVDFSTALDVFGAQTAQGAKEILQKGEEQRRKRAMEEQQMLHQQHLEIEQMREAAAQAKHQREIEKMQLEYQLKTELELRKAALVASGFADDKDANQNRIPDTIEIAEAMLEGQKISNKFQIDQMNQKIKAGQLALDAKKTEAEIKQMKQPKDKKG